MKAYVTSLALILAVSVAAVAQQDRFPEGPLDVDALRSEVMSRHFGPADRRAALDRELALPMVPMPAEPARDEPIWAEWGLSVAPVPQVLYLHCPKLRPGAGLLIEAVRPDGPAEQAGLAPGQVVAGLDDQWIFAPDELPDLDRPRNLVVLVAGKLRAMRVEPTGAIDAAAEPGGMRSTAPAQARAFGAAAGSRLAAGYASSAVDGSVEAISLACADGIYEIEASYATPEGRQKFRLSGTRRQVEKSMADLPAPLRQAIERRLETVSPEELHP